MRLPQESMSPASDGTDSEKWGGRVSGSVTFSDFLARPDRLALPRGFGQPSANILVNACNQRIHIGFLEKMPSGRNDLM